VSEDAYRSGGGTREIHKDNEHLATGTHKGATSATLHDPGALFDVFVAQSGLYIENVSRGTASTIAALDSITLTTAAGISWQNGDTYRIYKTDAKNSKISTEWVDVSRGWKFDKTELDRGGWQAEDRDLDKPVGGGHIDIFGTGQPERH
jgi:hypothetical protein